MRGIVKTFRRPPTGRGDDRNGGLPESCGPGLLGPGADGVARGSRCPAPPRHALLAASLGKPSLWVFINETWYKTREVMNLLWRVDPDTAAYFFPIRDVASARAAN